MNLYDRHLTLVYIAQVLFISLFHSLLALHLTIEVYRGAVLALRPVGLCQQLPLTNLATLYHL